MENTFKVGDRVQLKSGGPVMTINGINGPATHWVYEPLAHKVFCQWFDANDKLQSGTFSPEVLNRWEPFADE